MGLTSVVWRAPFVGLAGLLGGSEQTVYAVGSHACVASGMGLVVWLARRAASVVQLTAATLAAGLIVVGPPTLQAVHIGHPEDVLATSWRPAR